MSWQVERNCPSCQGEAEYRIYGRRRNASGIAIVGEATFRSIYGILGAGSPARLNYSLRPSRP
jgi:hypothetical protein